jgi:hypothetical protein
MGLGYASARTGDVGVIAIVSCLAKDQLGMSRRKRIKIIEAGIASCLVGVGVVR